MENRLSNNKSKMSSIYLPKIFIVSGSSLDSISGTYSVIPGGYHNVVSGDYSLAFGNSVTVDSNYVTAFYNDTLPGRIGINNPNPHSTLQADGSFATAIRSINSAPDTLNESDYTVIVDVSDSSTIYIPDPTTCKGRIYFFRNKDLYWQT